MRYSRWELWIAGWIEIGVGIVTVCSFGFITPRWDVNWLFNRATAHLDRRASSK